MKIPVTCAGVLRKENGLVLARGVTVSLLVNTETFGIGNLQAECRVYDDPAFGRRHTGDKFVFIPSHDPKLEFWLRVIDAKGTCVLAPVPNEEPSVKKRAGEALL